MSEMNAGGIASELLLKIEQFIGPLRVAIAESQNAQKAIGDGLGAASKTATAEMAKLGDSLGHMPAPAAAASKEITKLSEVIYDSAGRARDASGRFLTMQEKMALLGPSAGGAAGATSSLSGGLRALAGIAGTANPQIGQLVSGFTAAEGAAGLMGIALSSAIPIVAGVVGALKILKAEFDFGAASVRAAADLENITVAFTTMLGSVDAAKAKLRELQVFAASTPLTFGDTAQTVRSLVNVGVAVGDVMGHLKMLGDVATGAQTDISGLTQIYTQVISKGKADSMDLMQLANRSVPIYRALGQSMHINGDELRKMVEAGKVGFPEIEGAFRQMTGQSGQFHDAMAKASGSFDQLMSTMSDTWTQVQQAVGEVTTKNLDLKGIIDELTTAMVTLKPAIVLGFDLGTRAIAPFVELARALFDLAVQLMKPFVELGGGIDDAFGDGSADMIKNITVLMNPLIGAIKLAAEGVEAIVAGMKWIDEKKQAIANNIVAAFDSNVTADDLTREQEEEKAHAIEAGKVRERAAKSGEKAKAAKGAKPGDADGSPIAGGGKGSGKSKTPAETEADKAAKDREDSLARAADERAAAQVQAMRNAGDEEHADLQELFNQITKQMARASTKEERDALESKYAQGYAGIVNRHNKAARGDADEAKKKEDEAAKKKQEIADKAEDRTYELNAIAKEASLRAAGKGDDAEKVALDEKWRKNTRGMGLGAERDAALKAYEAEKAELVIKQQERAAKLQEQAAGKLDRAGDALGKAIGDAGNAMADVFGKASGGDGSFSFGDAMGANGYDAAQSRKIHESWGKLNFGGAGLGDVGGQVRERMARYDAAVNPGASAGGGGGVRGGGTGPVSVNVPGMDESKLAAAIAKETAPMYERIVKAETDKLRREIAAAHYAHGAGKGI